ncbi:OsmC family protein [Salmonella enterica]|nr:OsmC family protein [Salmonella enterica]
MTIHKKGQAHWEGDIKRGKGTVSTESGVLNQQPYGFNTRFEGAQGTNPEELIGAAHAACFSMALSLMLGEAGFTPTSNPEELIGAAHAACFSMALSLMLGEAGFTPTSIDTTADVSLDKVEAGFAITKIALQSKVAVADIDASTFDQIIQKAKAGCPVSQVLNAEITLDYQLNA